MLQFKSTERLFNRKLMRSSVNDYHFIAVHLFVHVRKMLLWFLGKYVVTSFKSGLEELILFFKHEYNGVVAALSRKNIQQSIMLHSSERQSQQGARVIRLYRQQR